MLYRPKQPAPLSVDTSARSREHGRAAVLSEVGKEAADVAHPHEGLLEDMTCEIRGLLASLGDVTGEQRREFEKGLYAVLTLKPTKRLATSLSTTREIAVVVTTFTDLQQRTVKFAQDEIASSKGRLDSSLVLIAHQDPHGDDSLYEWGRDLGLLVLPIFMQGNWRRAGTLESLLSRYLYAADPFDLAGPIRNAGQFYGRSDAMDVARRLQSGQVKAYFGIRKIGKTSMMNRILDHARSRFGSICIMADCQSDSLSSLKAVHLLDSITAALIEAKEDQTNPYRSVIPAKYNTDIQSAQWQFQHTLEHVDRPTIVALDEIDFITPSSPTSNHWAQEFNTFFRSLRAVYQEMCRVGIQFSILVGGVSSRWFLTESVGGVENAALAFVPEEYLGPFHRAQSINMAKTLGRSAGLQFSDEAADVLADTCGDIPYWIRKCGSHIHRRLDPEDRPVQVNAQQCAELAHEFVEGDGVQLAEVSIRHLFRVFPQLLPVLEAIYVGQPIHDRRQKRLLQVLLKYGVLDDSMAIRGPLMVAGVEGALEMMQDEQISVLGTDHLVARPPSVAELLDSMENDRVEFKSSARHSYRPEVPESVIHHGIVKSVAGFSNAYGGTLAIGIDDDGRVLGIEPDLKLTRGGDFDAYVNWITTLIVNALGASIGANCRVRAEHVADKCICLVDVPRSSEPVFTAASDGKKTFFVRMNNSTRTVDGPELLRYVQDRFSR